MTDETTTLKKKVAELEAEIERLKKLLKEKENATSVFFEVYKNDFFDGLG